jgi:glycerophosphoryl diester phosphodiesterase
MLRFALFALLTSASVIATPLRSEPGHAAEIAQRFGDRRIAPRHVMVLAHRGGWLENGRPVRAENSRAAIENAIAMGVEMVEIDVRKSADGELVVMHDSWLDRTTTCKGEVERQSLRQMQQCRLVVEGSRPTMETVPTLRDLLLVARGRITVNIDNKLGLDAIAEYAALARKLGMERDVVVKENIWNEGRLGAVKAALKPGVRFMPVLADDAVRNPSFATEVAKSFDSTALEMVVWRQPDAPTPDGGPLFTPAMQTAYVKSSQHVVVDTLSIVNMPGGPLAGGRGDKLGVGADLPGEAYGFWLERGATMIHTDEPKAVIDWLEAEGRRVPYGLTN